ALRGQSFRETGRTLRRTLTQVAEHFHVPGHERDVPAPERDKRARVASLGTMVSQLPEMYPYFAGRPWVLVEFPNPTVITSDEPIALWRRRPTAEESQWDSGAVGFATADLITLPLSPTAGLLMLSPAVATFDEDRRIRGDAERLRTFNRLTVKGPWTQLYRHAGGAAFPERPPMPAVGVDIGDLGKRPPDGWWKSATPRPTA
ncbi:MAG: DUF4238 domain-containing protein, partial [Solirubrobacteraceae bacterium]